MSDEALVLKCRDATVGTLFTFCHRFSDGERFGVSRKTEQGTDVVEYCDSWDAASRRARELSTGSSG